MILSLPITLCNLRKKVWGYTVTVSYYCSLESSEDFLVGAQPPPCCSFARHFYYRKWSMYRSSVFITISTQFFWEQHQPILTHFWDQPNLPGPMVFGRIMSLLLKVSGFADNWVVQPIYFPHRELDIAGQFSEICLFGGFEKRTNMSQMVVKHGELPW